MNLVQRYLLAGVVLLAGIVCTLVQLCVYRDTGATIATGAGVLFIVFLIVGDE